MLSQDLMMVMMMMAVPLVWGMGIEHVVFNHFIFLRLRDVADVGIDGCMDGMM